MKVITVCNAKGGCGKSTIALSLAASLGRSPRTRVLVLDAHSLIWILKRKSPSGSKQVTG